MAAWRMAKALNKLWFQINRDYPARSKRSDGGIGDENHARRDSDHNPWVRNKGIGIVTAIDITHDPIHGVDGDKLASSLIRDPRVKYVIWQRKIYNAAIADRWRPYRGRNPHTAHVHVSVHPIERLYDSERDWELGDEIKSVY